MTRNQQHRRGNEVKRQNRSERNPAQGRRSQICSIHRETTEEREGNLRLKDNRRTGRKIARGKLQGDSDLKDHRRTDQRGAGI